MPVDTSTSSSSTSSRRGLGVGAEARGGALNDGRAAMTSAFAGAFAGAAPLATPSRLSGVSDSAKRVSVMVWLWRSLWPIA